MGKAGDGCYRAIGLMSGTSMDGIDLALIETDGRARVSRGPTATFPYPEDFRRRIGGAILEAATLARRDERPGSLAQVEAELTRRHCEAVGRFLDLHELTVGDIDVIGFHGQTVLHRPEARLTVQLGDGAVLARDTGIDVVYDLRAMDCAAGGQGAPLAPVYHVAHAHRLPERPVAFVNIGGVANITYIGVDSLPLAFDCGPGNALIDDWVLSRTGRSCDTDGALAARGSVDEARIRTFLADPYFSRPWPKSLDRNAFSASVVDGLSPEDGAATLTAMTVGAIAKARESLPEEPRTWIITGGGRRNRTLMQMLAGQVANAVVPAEAIGLDGDSMEAEAWAYLAVRSLLGLAITFPGTTGVDRPLTGGLLERAGE
ncbi:MAG: hypothetical protein RLZ98_158 [Pseudomonadota bacterium]